MNTFDSGYTWTNDFLKNYEIDNIVDIRKRYRNI